MSVNSLSLSLSPVGFDYRQRISEEVDIYGEKWRREWDSNPR